MRNRMKNSLDIRCRCCGYEKDFYFGTGLIQAGEVDFDSEHALLPRLIKDDAQLAALRRQIEEEGGRLESDYRYGLFRCPECGAFYKRFEYQVIMPDGKVVEPEYRCDCGGELQPIALDTLNLKDYACPECGEKGLYEGTSGFAPLEADI